MTKHSTNPGHPPGPAVASMALLLLITLAIPAATAQSLDPLLRNANAASRFDYCDWIQDNAGADPSTLPDLERVIANPEGRSTTREVAAAILVSAGLQVARAQDSPRQCRKQFKRGEKLFSDAQHDAHRRLKRQADYVRSDDRAIANVQADLSGHWLDDQIARAALEQLQTDDTQGEEFWAKQRAVAFITLVDARATDYLRRQLRTHDWIDAERFGPSASQFAWMLVQQANDQPDLQALALERMQPFVESGAVDRENYAQLWDQVAVKAGRPQRYGTQPIWECRDGRLELHPMEDPQNVNTRRRRLGLDSVESSLARMSAEFCR